MSTQTGDGSPRLPDTQGGSSHQEPLRRLSRRRPWGTIHVGGLGLVLLVPGLAVSTVIDMIAAGGAVVPLAATTVAVAIVGLAGWRLTRVPDRITTADAFTAVSVTWIVVSLAGAVPYLLSSTLPTWDTALFESVSGFTATGSTVMSPIEGTSEGILFWRQLTQWYGGMGMIVLAVSVLPFLGVGGMELMSSEGPGVTSDRLAPRVADTARRLMAVYGGLTLASILALFVAGMGPYDALLHALTAVSTGGFSPYDTSISHFDSVAVEVAIMLSVFVGGVSFTLHWRAVRGDRGVYRRSSEFRLFLLVLVVSTLAVTVLNVGDGMAIGRAVRDSSFSVVSLSSSAGFGTADFTTWVPAAQLILIIIMIPTAMAGSTAGGLKLLRAMLLMTVVRRELIRVRHPRAVVPIVHDGNTVDEAVVARVTGFALLYVLLLGAGTIVLAMLGSDLPTSGGAIVSALGGVGPALGEAGPASTFLVYSPPARMVIVIFMLLGRLELFPLLLMFAGPLRRVRAGRPVRDPVRKRR
jgi:trk system potassium uptake protein TrkH